MGSPGSGPDCRRCSPEISGHTPCQTSLCLTATFECNYANLISRTRRETGIGLSSLVIERTRERFINARKRQGRPSRENCRERDLSSERGTREREECTLHHLFSFNAYICIIIKSNALLVAKTAVQEPENFYLTSS